MLDGSGEMENTRYIEGHGISRDTVYRGGNCQYSTLNMHFGEGFMHGKPRVMVYRDPVYRGITVLESLWLW